MSEAATHKSLDIFTSSKKLVVACYALTNSLPPEEKTNLRFYIRNAALTAHLAISQGAFLKKNKAKKKFLQKAKNSFVIIDAAVDIVTEVGFVKEEETREVLELSSLCFQQLDDLLKES